MAQDASTYQRPTSAGQDNMTFASQNPFEMWGGGYHPYTLHDQMEWLSNNTSHYASSMQTFPPTQQPSEQIDVSNGQTSNSHGQALAETTPTTLYPSQMYSSSVSPNQACDALMPFDGNSADRPLSAGTMLESGSTNTSRHSSISCSPVNRAPKFKVPAIRTQFENKPQITSFDGTPLGDGFQIAPDSDCMTTMSNEWMQIHDGNDLHSLHDPTLSAISNKSSSALLEPFQWQSPVTRRTSMSSAVSGPACSTYSTPGSAVWQQSSLTSPFSQQGWTPTSNQSRFSGSPVSPYQQKNAQNWNRAQYMNAMRQNRYGKPSAMSLPSRNKPRLVRNITDTASVAHSVPSTQSRARSVDSRVRARSDVTPQPPSAVSQQLALPSFQLSHLFNNPDMSDADFNRMMGAQTPNRNVLPSSANQTPMAPPQITPRTYLASNINSLHMSSPYSATPVYPHLPTNLPSNSSSTTSIPTPAHQPPLPTPSEPPLSDFLTPATTGTCSSSCTSTSPEGHNHNHPPACGPIRQSPHFEGDIYTPRFKRRNAAGKWEGWCGYCQPGRWLDLKNSRYWEDKLRNHGICARTKTFFEGPLRIRWVSDRGTIIEGETGDSSFGLTGNEGMEDDGVGRKREGLCGECNSWVPMDGMRSRGKGKCVAWWMHAYKCHEQSRSRTEGAGTFEQV